MHFKVILVCRLLAKPQKIMICQYLATSDKRSKKR